MKIKAFLFLTYLATFLVGTLTCYYCLVYEKPERPFFTSGTTFAGSHVRIAIDQISNPWLNHFMGAQIAELDIIMAIQPDMASRQYLQLRMYALDYLLGKTEDSPIERINPGI